MPIYEYKCDSCGKIFTKIQKFADEPLTVHEECGSGPVERLISTPAFHFKGTGWYVTDYAKSGAPNPSGEGKSGEGKSDGDKSETKPADSKPAETKTTSSESTSAPTKSETKPAPSDKN